MSKAQLVITAVVLEGRSKSEVARDYDVSRFWVHQLVKRYRAEGAAAFQPRSRRPHTSPHAVGAELEDKIVRLRKQLSKQAPYPSGGRLAGVKMGLGRPPTPISPWA
ncbi:MAG: helix-turn-helix domain-containing protein [Mycobacterium sp.]